MPRIRHTLRSCFTRTLTRFCAVAIMFYCASASWAYTTSMGVNQEYELKAAFVFNFAKFTEWPDLAFVDESTPIELCVVGVTPFSAHLDAFQGKTIHGRNINIKALAADADVSRCHIAYFGQSSNQVVTSSLGKVRGHSLLSIGEDQNFLSNGGLITLFVDNNKIKFRINVSAIPQAGLKISSKLLRLADVYREGE